MPKYVITEPENPNEWMVVALNLCHQANTDYEILAKQNIENAAKIEELRSIVKQLGELCIDVGFVRMCMHVAVERMSEVEKENADMRARLAHALSQDFPASGL